MNKIIFKINIISFSIIYYIFRFLFKVDKKKLIFISYTGKKFDCNPKYILEYMLENKYEFKYIVTDNNNVINYNNKNVKQVNIKSIKFLYQLATSKYWINNSTMINALKPKKTQIYIQTWHAAGAFKKFGLDIIDDRSDDKKIWNKDSNNWDILICSSKKVKDIYANAFKINPNKVLPLGLPRNDFFCSLDNIKNSKHKINNKIGNESNKKILLYAPTFRDGKDFNLNMDLRNMYNNLNKEFKLILKLHPNLSKNKIEIDDDIKNFVYNFTSHEDTQTLLAATDILITDYSSIIFDFAITGKPMIFYSFDLDEYKNKTRGFYYDYEKFVPGPIVKNEYELINVLKKQEVLNYSKEDILRFANEFNESLDGNATRRVVDLIVNEK